MAYKLKAWWIWPLAAMGLAWWWFQSNIPSTPQVLESDNTTNNSNAQTTKPSTPDHSQAPTNTGQPGPAVWLDEVPIKVWMDEIKTPQYSTDPVLEVAALIQDFRRCEIRTYDVHQNLKDQPAYQKMLALQQQVQQQCDEYQQRYPHWFKTKLPEKKLLFLSANTALGQEFHNLMSGLLNENSPLDYQEFKNQHVDWSLRAKQAGSTSISAFDHSVGIFEEVPLTAEFKHRLQTEDGLWVMVANQLALQKLSCYMPNSRSCEATAFYMLHQCQKDLTACGLNFSQWYQSHITPGLKQDVDILLTYYREQYP